RVMLELTDSLNGDGENQVPPVSVIGAARRFFGAEGRGSARLFSPEVEPREVEGGVYFLVDMGTQGIRFPIKRAGLMRMWGTNIHLDFRRIAGFGRDISAISEDE